MVNIKSFKVFSEETINPVVITFGRFNPPTLGHEKLIDKILSIAKSNKYRIFVSQSHDEKKNPLEYSEKINFMRKMFAKQGRSIIEDKSIITIFDALVKLYKQNFTKVIVVVGSDRVAEFSKLLTKYNGVSAKHGFYEFKDGIQIESAGERDPDSDDVDGMSASKMRAAAKDNNFDLFKKGLPRSFKEAKDLFNTIRKNSGLKESKIIRPTMSFGISEKREDYVKGKLFKVGSSVIINETNETGIIMQRKSNYVIVKVGDEEIKKWITAISEV